MELTNLAQFSSWLILAGLAAFAYLTWQQVRHGVYLIALFLPMYILRVTIFGIPSTVLELALVILILIWLIQHDRYKRIHLFFWKKQNTLNLIPASFRWPLILILFSALFATIISPQQPQALSILKAYFIEPIFYLIIVVYTIQTKEHVYRLLHALGIATVVIGLIAVWQIQTGLGIPNPFWAAEATRRITTFFGYPNANSLFVGPIVALYIGYLFKKDSPALQGFKILVITLGSITILGAQSMGAILALLVIAFIVMVHYKKTRSLAIALVVIALTLSLNSALLNNRISTVMNNISNDYLSLESTSYEIRINQWRETLKLISDRPISGAGLANYQQALKPYHSYDFLEVYLYPHNLVLNFWVELGILGLVAFVWLFIVLFRTIVPPVLKNKRKNPLLIGLLFAWIVIVIHGLVDVPYFKNDLSVLFMLLVALTILAARKDKKIS